jgi:hypothetical protein
LKKVELGPIVLVWLFVERLYSLKGHFQWAGRAFRGGLSCQDQKIGIVMANVSSSAGKNGIATTTRSTFRRSTAIVQRIAAKPEIVWSLLTNADDFPRWNSTVTSIVGPIGKGQKLAIRVKLDAKRVFKPKVVDFEPHSRMTWVDGMAPFFKGVRTFALTANADGTTTFSMDETLGGLMFPMAAGSIPDFKPAFEQYVADLKKEAEAIAGVR